MDNPLYITLSRQVGLNQAMQIVAHNLANATTPGFRREGAVFAEIVDKLRVDGGSIAQTSALVRTTDFTQGALRPTGNDFDLAIEGDGFFVIDTPDGLALTRGGSFTRAATGEIVTPGGGRLADEGGAPIQAPPTNEQIVISADGTMSVGGQPVARVGVVTVPDKTTLTRREDGQFIPAGGAAEFIPAEDVTVAQGYLEQSNVNPILEMSRMIEIQRAYEAGQSLLQSDDERQRLAARVMAGG